MRWFSLAPVVIAAALLVSLGGRGFAQDQNQPAGNSPAPSDSRNQGQDKQGQATGKAASQPAKKRAAKAKDARDPASANSSSSQASSSDSSQAPAPSPAKDENPFPEAVSRAAAQATPDAPGASGTKGSPASAENPFPEDVSRSAAKRDADSSAQAGDGQKPETQAPETQTKDPLPPGVSSSRSADDRDDDVDSGDSLPGGAAGGKIDQSPAVQDDPARAKHDAQVGGFYLQTGDNRGAYLRFQDALRHDPTNVDAIFGLAEAAKALKLVAEAQRNYQLYLEIVPQGAKAKEAIKALRSLDTQK